LIHLKTEKIHFLQWLYRTEPLEEERRIKGLIESVEEIENTLSSLVKKGLVGAVGTFPYTVSFGKEVSKKIESVNGWITYFNLLEKENLQNLPNGDWLIGIRPLAAGKVAPLFDQLPEEFINNIFPEFVNNKRDSITKFCLAYCLMQEKVKTNILSINSVEQGENLITLLKDIQPLEKEYLSKVEKLLETSVNKSKH